MSVLFVCDHRFAINEQKVFSNTFSYKFFKPYLNVYSNVTVVGRATQIDRPCELQLASGEGVDFIFLQSISTLRSFFGLRQKHKAYLESLIDQHEEVIVRLPSELGLLAAAVARQKGKKCLVEVMGCAWDALWNYGSIKAKLYAPYMYLKMKSAVKHADFVTYDTEMFLQQRYPCAKHAHSQSIPDVRLGVMDEQVLSRRMDKIQSLSSKTVFGTIGNLNVDYKGIDIAIKALSLLAKKEIDFEYRILGTGNVDKYGLLAQKYLIGQKVFFDGVVSKREEIDHWLDGIDIYLQPSLAEAFCRSLVEAMSRGCPAIGSDVGGIPELLDSEAIFSSKDAEKLAEVIQRFLADRRWMSSQAERNFHRVERYQVTLMAQKRERFLSRFKEYR